MDWRVDPDADVQPSRQLVDRALDAIAAGRFAAGDCLPSVRALAAAALVNPNTAARAWRELERLGVARGRNGAGVFVTTDGPRIARELRRAATRAALERAWAAALGAGHDPADLVRELNRRPA
jgi:DNA-binding transcriptional regulator YhcF (GntR family)